MKPKHFLFVQPGLVRKSEGFVFPIMDRVAWSVNNL